MVVRTSRSLVATLACVCALHASACSDVQHVVGKQDLSASGGTPAVVAGNRAPSGGSGGVGGSGGIPLGGAFPPFDASLPDAMPECTSTEVAVPRRVNLYLVVDRTLAQNVLVAWPTMVDGIGRYARMPEARGTGLGYDLIGIPLTETDPDICTSSDYRRPVVGIQREPLPANVDNIEDGLAGVAPSLTSALLPAMKGALYYVSSVRDSYREHHAIVLITDSLVDADDCGSTVASVSEVAAEAQAGGTRTYVIENVVPLIGQLPVLDDFLAQLEPIAVAGGTSARKLGVGTDLAAMLHEIQKSETPLCQYALPEGYAWDQVQLAISDPDGPRPFQRLDGEELCYAPDGGGVYIDAATGFATACPAACQVITESGSQPIWVTDCGE